MDFGLKSGLDKRFELDEKGLYLGFCGKWINPGISGEVINKNKVIFVVLI